MRTRQVVLGTIGVLSMVVGMQCGHRLDVLLGREHMGLIVGMAMGYAFAGLSYGLL
jgi:hypothetical protein